MLCTKKCAGPLSRDWVGGALRMCVTCERETTLAHMTDGQGHSSHVKLLVGGQCCRDPRSMQAALSLVLAPALINGVQYVTTKLAKHKVCTHKLSDYTYVGAR